MDEKNFISRDQLTDEFKEFKKFAFSGNLIAMALSLISAQTIQKFVSTISESVFMPFINYFVSHTDGNWRNLVFIPVSGMQIELGKLLGSFIEFVITITIIYIIYSKIVKKFDPTVKI